jgi:hypothetical protein
MQTYLDVPLVLIWCACSFLANYISTRNINMDWKLWMCIANTKDGKKNSICNYFTVIYIS